MAWKGPAGLLGEPAADRRNEYSLFPVQNHEQIMVHVHQDIFTWLETARPTPEGDYLFHAEGFGRLRFRFAPGTIPVRQARPEDIK